MLQPSACPCYLVLNTTQTRYIDYHGCYCIHYIKSTDLMNSLYICSCSVLQLATQGTTISAVHKWQPLGSTDGSEMWWQCIPCIQGTWHPPEDPPQLDEALEYKEQVCSSHQENRVMLESALLTECWTVLRSNSEIFSICKGSRKPLQYFLGLSEVCVKTSSVKKAGVNVGRLYNKFCCIIL
jgi:hypothetical protein